jgi:hypothetical protein
MPFSNRLGALVFLATWGAGAQDQQELPKLRVTVTLVQVDAVVTDSSGRHVAGLTADDFELLQDGQPQKITHLSYIAAPPPV